MNISVQHITKTYKAGKKALDNVSIEVTSPAMIGLVGPNGAGKTTLMKLLVAALQPTSGTIMLNNNPIGKKEKYLKSVLGYLPQSFGLYDELTVWQFLDYMSALKQIINNKEEISRVLWQTNLEEIQKRKLELCLAGKNSG